MKKVFVSQAMRGRSVADIEAERERLIQAAKKAAGEEIEVLDSYFKDFNGNALAFLGKSISLLSQADAAIFCDGWMTARGCRIEHQCCCEYNIPFLNPNL